MFSFLHLSYFVLHLLAPPSFRPSSFSPIALSSSLLLLIILPPFALRSFILHPPSSRPSSFVSKRSCFSCAARLSFINTLYPQKVTTLSAFFSSFFHSSFFYESPLFFPQAMLGDLSSPIPLPFASHCSPFSPLLSLLQAL